MDTNGERRALRKRIMALHGVEVICAGDLVEASSIWQRDRYDLVLIDIRTNHYGCLAWRDEIRKEMPAQVVAFLVGGPKFIDVEPLLNSYVPEEYGAQWGESMRSAVRDACSLLPQRNGFIEVGWRIAAARKMTGLSHRNSEAAARGETPKEIVREPRDNAADARLSAKLELAAVLD